MQLDVRKLMPRWRGPMTLLGSPRGHHSKTSRRGVSVSPRDFDQRGAFARSSLRPIIPMSASLDGFEQGVVAQRLSIKSKGAALSRPIASGTVHMEGDEYRDAPPADIELLLQFEPVIWGIRISSNKQTASSRVVILRNERATENTLRHPPRRAKHKSQPCLMADHHRRRNPVLSDMDAGFASDVGSRR